MSPNWSIREETLNVFADDGESIVQVENSLRRAGMNCERKVIKDLLVSLLQDSLLKIVYPYDRSLDEFILSGKETIEEYWFEMTDKGRAEWKACGSPE